MKCNVHLFIFFINVANSGANFKKMYINDEVDKVFCFHTDEVAEIIQLINVYLYISL